ncbi:AAA family ATPase [Thermosipho atlanticus]|uniref:DNA repair protein RecN n=1 Tax=Thermosipho atlanticus DSM 15807 TaxID=1123380 RepID=A0A1M5R365_9BACT|nr:AAA family ATPase [Thermosipho atlanticus]SHH20470.1 DNA replication and repair protein RecN [Thermosipho atlanticus DSM 15807]
MTNGMIISIHLNDYLYFKNVDVYFDKGLNVFTGETGAGKSLLLDVLGILLGLTSGRVDNYNADVVVELPQDYPDYEINSGENIFSITKKNGRTIFKVNGRVFPKNIVSEILNNIISMHRQNSHLKFLESNFLISVLDEVAQNYNLLSKFSKLYSQYKSLLLLLKSENLEELKRRKSELEIYIEEIEKVNPNPVEEQELEEKYKVALNLQQNIQNYNELLNMCENVSSEIWAMKKVSPDKFMAQIDAAFDIIETMKLDIQRELSNIEEYDVSEIEEKIWDYNSLKRKYGPTIEDVLRNYEQFKKQFNEITSKIELLENSNEKVQKFKRRLEDLGAMLTKRRKETASIILNTFIKHARDLNLNADLDIVFENSQMTSRGFDKVEIVGRMIKNEPLKPIRNIASGGELSRLMLALELSIASGGVLIFDEIDAGISGETGNKLAEKLKEVSKKYQVIVVTHLPQIAVRADKHFVVTREEEVGIVKELSEKEKIKELKRMVGSEDVLSFIDKVE